MKQWIIDSIIGEVSHFFLIFQVFLGYIQYVCNEMGTFGSEGVTPRPAEYENATALYIYRVKYLYVYTLSISVQSGIRVRKHSSKIYSHHIVQVQCYHST